MSKDCFNSLLFAPNCPTIFERIIILLLANLNNQSVSTYQEYQKESAIVNRVIDGDTIETDNGTIRLLGINNKEV
ncbi:MAG: hypothetical protein Q8N99_03905 [Nanoarchaeota archaeon]|nr:hypothetical protein [Nanoarchaeota archaeon]